MNYQKKSFSTIRLMLCGKFTFFSKNRLMYDLLMIVNKPHSSLIIKNIKLTN